MNRRPAEPNSRRGLPTSLKLSGGLEQRSISPPTGFQFSAPPRQGLAPAEFLICISPEGRPLYLFPQVSSGNESLDRAALRYLAATRFSEESAGSPPAWGVAKFLWGVDVEREKEP